MVSRLGDHQGIGGGGGGDVVGAVGDFEGDVVAAVGQRRLVYGVSKAVLNFIGGDGQDTAGDAAGIATGRSRKARGDGAAAQLQLDFVADAQRAAVNFQQDAVLAQGDDRVVGWVQTQGRWSDAGAVSQFNGRAEGDRCVFVSDLGAD